MSFPTTPILDTATRANENPLSNGGKWGTLTGLGLSDLQIISNQIVGTSAALANDGMYWNVATFKDSVAYATIQTLLSDTLGGVFLLVRLDTATLNGYAVQYDRNSLVAGNDTLIIVRLDGGAATPLSTSSMMTIAVGDSFGVTVIGNTLTSWFKSGSGLWTQIGTATDSTYTVAGNIGINEVYNVTSPGLTNFGGGAYRPLTRMERTPIRGVLRGVIRP